MNRTTIITVVILVGIIAVTAVLTFTSNTSERANVEGSDLERAEATANNAQFTDLDGNPITLSSFDEEVLVVNAWASWCPFCVDELPDFEQLGAEYASDSVRIIAINRAESANTARAFVSHVGDPEHVTFLLDPEDTFYDAIGGFAMPETVFYDKTGSIVAHARGFMGIDDMRERVEAVKRINAEE